MYSSDPLRKPLLVTKVVSDLGYKSGHRRSQLPLPALFVSLPVQPIHSARVLKLLQARTHPGAGIHIT